MANELTPLSSTLLVSSRRGYLQTLASLVGAAASAAASSAVATTDAALMPAAPSPAGQRASAPEPILLQTSPVAGFQYHKGESIWAAVRVGDQLSLVREASNRYDERAVRLEWGGQKIGYVPARDNAAVSQLLDRGASLCAEITQLQASPDPWKRVEFMVYLTVG